jgi:hypothetical protein
MPQEIAGPGVTVDESVAQRRVESQDMSPDLPDVLDQPGAIVIWQVARNGGIGEGGRQRSQGLPDLQLVRDGANITKAP